ncbi:MULTISPECIES: acyl-CoA dehydrogenase [unclassified Mesorhizobium]|uniref:acyl-CoA dehydrogenase n=1 Tax=unclassified Mesorhizobium TaxID=325217 RepID=UPI000FCB1EE5|nr:MULTISPECIES: acyl-CoA dehydrogenase [unclassified Mesorhizobium]RUT90580.1 acyl-CoA dehydrogenase [Mesorhizobium sp. M7A.T.Ca.US.000.02.2.1]RUU02041.1 acyl-CoA dehydrogenase [Mesorhizobium sp. M7A.T.Ca.TU.009.02.1.1]RUU63613.1 acyl-CoA dehydrogenase [Mesorhizobium sp. M7A.T.Ca.TU.009.01.1.1]RUU83898.1 acyl-CoA dehydrogenase [Mesorhizobium sp. M7A.T.Ca.TU.009.01.1.2]
MYRAPVEDIAFTLKHVAGMKSALDAGTFGDLGEDLVDAVLGEAGRFATEEVTPLYTIGDRQGAVLKGGAVTTPPGWKELYRRWIDGGWNALSGPEEYGGQALPTMLGVAALEMWNSAAMAFGIGPTLTMGAVEALDKHASEDLKAKYLEKLVSGEWMGTMNLTEPQAGSDLAALRARAEPAGDGSYRIFGQKIFITYGEHDFTDNIIHLVLARLPDAPAGTRGISLFLVPKFLVGDDGALGARNDVFCSGLEHKLGIHASPTCTMIYGDGFEGAEPGAVGWLIGEANKGLACMFTMMNNARLCVGMQGVAVAEAATQKAIAYANERRQGKAASYTGTGMAPIVHHPDVQRNLLTMKALTQTARAISYSCAHAIDMARVSAGDEAAYWRDRANLLTPLAKAFSTDIGVEVASLGLQVHGGMGFIEETGAAAFYRDARIAPIYEGTNGIQAIDLVMRKLPLGGGDHVHGYIAELADMAGATRTSNMQGFGRTADALDAALGDLSEATRFLQKLTADGRSEEALAGATPYLRLISLAAGGAYLARGALADHNRIALCRFFAENLLGEVSALRARVIDGAESLAAAGKTLVSA